MRNKLGNKTPWDYSDNKIDILQVMINYANNNIVIIALFVTCSSKDVVRHLIVF